MVAFDSITGLMTSVTVDGVVVPMTQSLMWYAGCRQGPNGGTEDRPSGAYVFRPNGTEPHKISETATVTVFKGITSCLFM